MLDWNDLYRLARGPAQLKNISSDSTPRPEQSGAKAPKRQFIVIEIPRAEEPDYPKAIFACDTLEEALNLSKQMNADAGYERYGVQRPAPSHK